MTKKPLMVKAIEKHPRAEDLVFSEDDIRWATPQIVAEYRAKRIKESAKGDAIIDIGAGIGFQTFAFARFFKKVYAIEIDAEKIERAKKNAALLGINNIEFINKDALDKSIIKELKDACAVFCDPERAVEEKERTIATIKPNLKKLIELYSTITQNIAIECPPQMKTIPFDCEKEYISLYGRLNRLTLYFGGLRKAESSAVVLPSEERLASDQKSVREIPKSSDILDYLLEVDPAVAKAGLISELCEETDASLFADDKAILLTSSKEIESSFFVNMFHVAGRCAFDEKEIIRMLQQNNASKVVIRYSIDPKKYWGTRERLQKRLTGAIKFHLFKFQGQAVIVESISNLPDEEQE